MEYPSYNSKIPHGSTSKLIVSYKTENVPFKTKMINIEGEMIEIPMCMLENGNLFRSIFIKRVFYSLPLHSQQYLCKFLPQSNVKSLDEHLTNAFTPYPVFNFPNNFEKLRYKLNNNHFEPSYLENLIAFREIKRVLFEHFYRQYNLKLMKKLFISRHEILERATLQGNNVDLNNFPSSSYKIRQKKRNGLESNISRRANFRIKRMLDDVKRLANDSNPYSSDEEEIVVKKSKYTNIRSSIYNSKINDIDLYEPTETKTIKEMLKEHKKLKECHPDSPSLDTEGITLFDVYSRAGLSIQLEKNFGAQQKERIEKKSKFPFVGGRGNKKMIFINMPLSFY
ncbi:Hypothetical protein SRAE_2000220700 [Strongyloides ratti]|uniref:Uncharacterized protein n=1 Tax=Strongyloides ratti TaxID=34506 RepID=A0A090LJ42_STRRB|nr:Hypothetical protein SRAE_2000220700 [Strongyloides ratti]CEF67545.1 Hypothetical protein SRAE_2000220700 [Strongyloides ratti]